MRKANKSTAAQSNTEAPVAPTVNINDKIELSVAEVVNVMEFVLNKPMKVAREFMPVVTFFENKLADYKAKLVATAEKPEKPNS